jgi:hypothetical protein
MSNICQTIQDGPSSDQLAASGKPVESTSTNCGSLESNGSSSKLPSSSDRRKLDVPHFVERYRDLPEEIVKKVFESSNALIELYHLFGLKREKDLDHKHWLLYQEVLNRFRTRMCDYLILVKDATAWINFLKFKTCSFYAFYENQERPTPPKGLESEKDGVIFGGFVNKWVQLLRKKDSDLFESFIVSINLAKKGLPRPTPDMLEEACKKTVMALTTEPYVPERTDFILDETAFGHYRKSEAPLFLSKEIVKSEIRRTVKELFADNSYTNELHYKPFFPSTSANYNKSRGNAGAVRTVVDEVISLMKKVENDPELVHLSKIDVKTRGKLSEHYGNTGIQEELNYYEELTLGKEFNEIAVSYDDTKLQEKWKSFMDLLKVLAYDEKPLVEAVGLLEALKIRVISKGPPLLYTFLKPMQKFMWSTLKDNEVFKLISEPINERHINDMFPNICEEEIMVNGDYKASTDNIHGYCSEEVVNCLVDTLNENKNLDKYYIDEKHREMFIRSLTKHRFQNPLFSQEAYDTMIQEEMEGLPMEAEYVPKRELIESQRYLPQREGQLMGSITSFPILCIINATLCRMSIEQTESRRLRIRDKPIYFLGEEIPRVKLLINGDDCTLKSWRYRNLGLQYNWSKITQFGGLSSSVGKTLFSLPQKPICVLNSMTYHRKDGFWHSIKAINLGILFGKMRSTTVENQKREYHQLGALHRDLKKECPERLWSACSSRFIHYQKDVLDKFPNIPWVAPEYLGGPGLIPEKPITLTDLKVMSILISNLDDPKSKMQVRKCIVEPEWKVHKMAEDKLKSIHNSENYYMEIRPKVLVSQSEEFRHNEMRSAFQLNHENYQQLTESLTVDFLFHHEVEDLFEGDQLLEKSKKFKIKNLEKKNKQIMNKNMSSWKLAYERSFTYHGFVRTEAEIMHERKVLTTLVVKGREEWFRT